MKYGSEAVASILWNVDEIGCWNVGLSQLRWRNSDALQSDCRFALSLIFGGARNISMLLLDPYDD